MNLKKHYEPKKNNQFLVEFPEQFNITQDNIKTITKPFFKNGNWQNIKIEFVDFI